MSQSAARSFGARETLEVDAMIETEIRELEQQAKADVRGRGVDDSMDFGTGMSGGGYGARGGGATLRDSMRSSFGGLGGSVRNSIEGLDNAQYTRGGGGGGGRGGTRGGMGASVDTLGSTGIKALLMPELRLDGQKPDENDGDDLDAFLGRYNLDLNTSSASAGTGTGTGAAAAGSGVPPVDRSNPMKNVNDDMDNLLKHLTGGESRARTSASFSFGGSPVGGSLVANSIPEITQFLQSEFMTFEKAAEERRSGVEINNKEQKIREDRIREEGRAEARARGLFGINHVSTMSGVTPADKVPASNPLLPPSMMDEVKALSTFLGPETHAALTGRDGKTHHMTSSVDSFAAAGGAGGVYKPKVSTSEMAPLQYAIDNEMGAADEILYRMRALRSGLGQRLRRLDSLHAQVMNDKDSGMYIPPAAAAAVAPGMVQNQSSSGRPPLSGQTSQWHAPAAGPGPGAVAGKPSSSFGTGADAPAPMLPERIAVQMQEQMAEKVAHVGQSISSMLTVTMEGMVHRLAANHAAQEVMGASLSGAVPATSGAVPAPAPQLASAPTTFTVPAVAAPAAGASVAPAVDVRASYGETVAQMRDPVPPKSLKAQLDEMDAALGAENGPGAPVGLDQFLPLSVRTQNAVAVSMTVNEGRSSPINNTGVRSLSPSPFKTGQWSPPPMLYQIPKHAMTASPCTADRGGSREPVRVVAPSDEELWLKHLQDAGTLAGGGSLASAPALPQRVPAVPAVPAAPQHKLLPWKTSGADANTLRTRPLEGMSLLYNRSVKQDAHERRQVDTETERVAQLAAQEQQRAARYGMYAQNAPQQEPASGSTAYNAIPQGGSSAAAQSVSERDQYLRKMQAIRQGMLQLSC